jgi:hypothetical protein
MGVYVDHLLEKGGLTERSDLAMGTLAGYISAATTCLRFTYGLSHSFLSEGSMAKTAFVRALLEQRRTWKQPRDQKEPLSSEMLTTMYLLVRREELRRPGQGDLGQDSCVFDCVCLSIFTGSRLGEFGQSNVRKIQGSDGFDPVPDSVHVPPAFRGKPLAFISSDFEFLDDRRRLIPHVQALEDPAAVRKLRVRFRYDKGPDNFTFRTFNRTGHFLCAVAAALSLVRRAMRIHRDFTSDSEPLAMFLAVNRRRWTVRGRHVQQFMQKACILAHPDARHHLRRYIHCLMTHCGRVTAAVALFNAGASIDLIAFCLRWKSDAVRLYLRDCYRSIGTLTSDVLRGAFDDVAASGPIP